MLDPYEYKTALQLLFLYGVIIPFFPFCFLLFGYVSHHNQVQSSVSFTVVFLYIGSDSLRRASFFCCLSALRYPVQATVAEW